MSRYDCICFQNLSICLSLCQYHTVLTDVKSITLSVFFLLKFGLIILGSWHFPMKFRISLSIPTMKMSPGIFDWGCNKSKNQFGENWHLYHIESASPLKRYIPLCLLHLWSIYFIYLFTYTYKYAHRYNVWSSIWPLLRVWVWSFYSLFAQQNPTYTLSLFLKWAPDSYMTLAVCLCYVFMSV